MHKVLVVAVHPDDETLGCGGTLLKHKANGDEIHWMVCSEVHEKSKFFEKKEKEILKANSIYGFDSMHRLGLEAIKIDEYTVSELVGKISNVISKIDPDILYLPFKGDTHSDHRKIFEAAYACTKTFRYPSIKKIYMMEALSETEFAPATKEDAFVPNVFIDISDYIDKKIEIASIYESEMGEYPFPRSPEIMRALAMFRGSTAGCRYAESFMLLKEIR